MRVMIVGLGKLGYKLAESIISREIDVTVMDSNPTVLDRINEHLDVLSVNANGLEIQMLRELNSKSYDILIATTKSDDTNALICTLAKKLGCKKTIARIRTPEYLEQLDFIKHELGIDHVVNPDLATSHEIMRFLMKTYYFATDDYAKGKVQMIDFCINDAAEFIGKRIQDLENMKGLLISGVLRGSKLLIPNGETELKKDDIIYIIGESQSICQLAERCKLDMDQKKITKVFILGGGNIGYYLAQNTLKMGMQTTIIEQDATRCKYLSDHLENAMVIQGDGTDIDLLEEEDLETMDAFVGLTGYDEQNLLMSLVAKQEGVTKAIAKISRPGYAHLVDKLGIDFALNPVNMAVSDILKFIRGGKSISVSLLLGDQAEVTEVIVDAKWPYVNKPLADIGLSKGIIIGALVRDGQVIIPNGRTMIKPEDRMIVLCLTSELPELEAFLNPKKGGVLHELWRRNQGIRKAFNR